MIILLDALSNESRVARVVFELVRGHGSLSTFVEKKDDYTTGDKEGPQRLDWLVSEGEVLL